MSNDKEFDKIADYNRMLLANVKLHKTISDQQKIIDKKDAEIERLKKENKILKKAVRHYADTRKWGVTCPDDLPDFQDDEDNEQLTNYDGEKITKGGRMAREALSEVEK